MRDNIHVVASRNRVAAQCTCRNFLLRRRVRRQEVINLDEATRDGYAVYRQMDLSAVMALAERIDVVSATEGRVTVVQDAPMRNSLDASWHQDGLSLLKPPSKVLLYCEAPGRADITTDLAEVETALSLIDPSLKKTLQEISTCYMSRSGKDFHEVPLVRIDPSSGREFLSLCSRGWVRGVADTTLEQVSVAMAALYSAIVPIHQHKWEAGDCLVFDNLKYVHRRHNPDNHIDPARRLIRIWFE